MKYTRNKNSHYATYRAQNPQSADFIAPQGKVANFMNPFDYVDPDQAMQMLQGAGHAVRGGLNALGQGAQDLYASGVAKTGINLPGIADQAGNAFRGAVNQGLGAENGFLQGQMQGVRALGNQLSGQAQNAWNYAMGNPAAQQAMQGLQAGADQAGQALGGIRQGLSQAGSFLGNAASGIDPVQAGELGAASTGAAAGGLALGRMARARRAAAMAGQGVQEAAQAVPGLAQRAMGAVQGMSPNQKLALGGGALAAGGLGAYGVGRMLEDDPNAQYSAQSIAQAKFSKRNVR